MSNEITLSYSIKLSSGYKQVNRTISSLQLNQTTSEMVGYINAVPANTSTLIDLSALDTKGICFIQNVGDSNAVSIETTQGAFVTLQPAEFFSGRLVNSEIYYANAVSGTTDIQVIALNA